MIKYLRIEARCAKLVGYELVYRFGAKRITPEIIIEEKQQLREPTGIFGSVKNRVEFFYEKIQNKQKMAEINKQPTIYRIEIEKYFDGKKYKKNYDKFIVKHNPFDESTIDKTLAPRLQTNHQVISKEYVDVEVKENDNYTDDHTCLYCSDINLLRVIHTNLEQLELGGEFYDYNPETAKE